MTKKVTIRVEYDDSKQDYYIQLPDHLIEQLGWKVDDTLTWKDNGDGSWSIEKKYDEKNNDS